MKGLDGGRINIATTAVGTAQAALERTLSYVGQRQQFGQPIGAFQHTQFELADMATELPRRTADGSPRSGPPGCGASRSNALLRDG